MWFQEYGVPFDLRDLPEPMFQAHMAILNGKAKKAREEHEEAERERKRAGRQPRSYQR